MSDGYPNSDVYAVGKDAEGNTTLKIFADVSTITLTMSDLGTRTLIRLLQATLEEENEVLDDQLP